MTYDADDRLITQTDPFGLTLTYGYDGNGNVVSEQDSLGGLTTSVYDADNRLVSRRFSDGTSQLRIDFAYDGDGNILTEKRYADLAGTQLIGVTQNSYDADDRVTQILDTDANGNILENFQYTYDAGSRLISEIDNGVTTNYTYNADNELLSDGSNTYTYDANGNRTNAGYVTGPNNELLSDGTWNYSYDAEGNLIEKVNIATGETWTYTYNNDNLMTSAVDQAANGTVLSSETLTYDVFDNLIEQAVSTTSTAVTRFAYDSSGNVWADLDGSNALQTRRLFLDGPDQPFARITAGSGAEAWYLTDHLGSIRGITDGSGDLEDQINYDAFGNVTSQTNALFGDRYQFTGAEFDTETGLQYNWARYYNPTTGRWTTQDPIGFGAGDVNLYSYVANGPTNAIDPAGLQPTPLTVRPVPPPLGIGTGIVHEEKELADLIAKLPPEEQAKIFKKEKEFNPWLGGNVEIRFNPTLSRNKKICCDEIVHLQVVQVWDETQTGNTGTLTPILPAVVGWNWLTPIQLPSGAALDISRKTGNPVIQMSKGAPGEGAPKQVIGFLKANKTSQQAVALDTPGLGVAPPAGTTYFAEFETFPACRKGRDQGQFYDGGVRWEESSSGAPRIIRQDIATPSKQFMQAYAKYKAVTGKDPLK